jgi:hypothetical protein
VVLVGDAVEVERQERSFEQVRRHPTGLRGVCDQARGLRDQTRRASFRELVGRLGVDRVADPATLCLPAGSTWTPDSVLAWVPLVRVRTGEQVWAPLDLVASDGSDRGGLDGPALVPTITNGLGAGLDDERPVRHGVLEILQRHTNGLRFRALDARSPEIDHDVLAATTRVGEVRVAKVLVTGLEVETLSYGRIGELGAADLLQTDLDLVRRGDGPSESHPARVVLTTEAEERLGGLVWYSYAAAERLVGARYPLYREPPRHLVEV